ncbi:MAG TPA: hypothetical protein VLJ58_20430 [Ramlibacter sp.]|nr:hypothetical protein [Ramlibacter sp.]
MRFALACAAALLAAPALAQDVVAFNGRDSVRLTSRPCTSEQVLGGVPQAFRASLREATAVVEGQSYKACWLPRGDDAHLLYEDGDQGLIPMSDFKAPTSA